MQDITTIPEVAEKFGVTTRSVCDWITKGELPPPVQLGRKRFWFKETLDDFLAAKVSHAAEAATQSASRGRYAADGRPLHRMTPEARQRATQAAYPADGRPAHRMTAR